jgi:hypothetical protein
MSIKARLAVFTVLFGITVILFLGFFGIDLPYAVKYLVLLGVVALYVAVVAVLESFRKKRI